MSLRQQSFLSIFFTYPDSFSSIAILVALLVSPSVSLFISFAFLETQIHTLNSHTPGCLLPMPALTPLFLLHPPLHLGSLTSVWVMPFHVLYSWCFDVGGLADSERTALNSYRHGRTQAGVSVLCQPPNPEPIPQPPTLWGSYTLSHCSSALIIPGPGARELGTIPRSQGSLQLFKLDYPKVGCPASLIPSVETSIEALVHVFPPPFAFKLTLMLPQGQPSKHGICVCNSPFTGNHLLISEPIVRK